MTPQQRYNALTHARDVPGACALFDTILKIGLYGTRGTSWVCYAREMFLVAYGYAMEFRDEPLPEMFQEALEDLEYVLPIEAEPLSNRMAGLLLPFSDGHRAGWMHMHQAQQEPL